MYTVQSIVRAKGGELYTIGPSETVLQAARVMNEHKIGSLVVVQGQKPVGIITERDILMRIVAGERVPSETLVQDVMTCTLLTCTESTPLADVRRMMMERRIRHVPVVEGEQLRGMVSIGDLNKAQTQALEHTVAHLEHYIQQ